jgi:hypothetical protein
VQLEKAKTYEEYRRLAEEVDEEEGMMDWRYAKHPHALETSSS